MKNKAKSIELNRLTQKRPGLLTETEAGVLRRQIRRNSIAIDVYIKTIDLLVNKEQCPKDANTLLHLRKRLDIAILENDTFRNVLWRHIQIVGPLTSPTQDSLTPISFLICRMKSRKSQLMAQYAMK